MKFGQIMYNFVYCLCLYLDIREDVSGAYWNSRMNRINELFADKS